MEKWEQLVLDNLKLVKYIVYHHIRLNGTNSNDLREDLIQEGNLALIDAAKMFDESKGIKFSTYASQSIINRCIRKLNQFYYKDIGKVISENDILPSDEYNFDDSFIDSIPDVTAYIDNFIDEDNINNFIRICLTDKQRTVAYFLIQGLTPAEIARQLKTSRQNISHIMKSIRKRYIKHSTNKKIKRKSRVT